TARRNLSFAEKAHFARQLSAAGHDTPFISAALSTTVSDLSRMRSLTARIPADLMYAIGAAPSVGRDRWLHFAGLLSPDSFTADDLTALVNLSDAPTSDARFQYALDTLQGARAKARLARRHVTTRCLITQDGVIIGKAKTTLKKTTLTLASREIDICLDVRRSDGFDDWLVENLAHVHQQWLTEQLQTPKAPAQSKG
ncbi:MAG: plasmid partitioning protein RepB C-terminal domain-containing protein, partial [Paracoccaceae bacterium]